MRGYVDSSLDADAFTPDGFLHTGDLGRFDKHGAIIITGRIKDIIIRKGRERVGQGSRGRALRAPRDRRRQPCSASPTRTAARWSSRSSSPADCRGAANLKSIFDHCRESGLMTQKIPERLEIIEVMPRNPSGKVPSTS